MASAKKTKATTEAKATSLTATPKLYKVLTSDGRSPYITTYAWSLPQGNGDGTWTPGAWHEEPAEVFDRGEGLHITPKPLGYWPRHDCVAYEVEAGGYREDPLTESHVVALRVRLMRPVTEEEARRASYEWDAESHARQLKEQQREQLDRAREAAAQHKGRKEAERREGCDSPAMIGFRTLVELTPTSSWRDVNGCRLAALQYAMQWLDFDPEDVSRIYRDFGGAYWFGADHEHLYARAVASENKSAAVAFEHFLGRKPWWHTTRLGRERLCVGSTIVVDGMLWRVTSFHDDHLIAVGEDKDGKGRRRKFTREQAAGRVAGKVAEKEGAR